MEIFGFDTWTRPAIVVMATAAGDASVVVDGVLEVPPEQPASRSATTVALMMVFMIPPCLRRYAARRCDEWSDVNI